MKNYSPKILITGSNGQLGTALKQHPLARHFQLYACSRDKLDITDASMLEQIIKQYHPNFIINTAAYTNVDQAETAHDQAFKINEIGAQQLAITCEKHHIPLIHLSTDYIFDGENNTPYQEDDVPTPINLYGKSKWLGEIAIRKYCDAHLILRVSGVFSAYQNNFLKTILRLANEKTELRIVSDQITCPTSADDIARVIYTLLQDKMLWGTYHYCNLTPISWYEFAVAIVKTAQKYQSLQVKDILPIATKDYPRPAKRPAYSVLNCDKIFCDYGIKQSSWQLAIDDALNQLIGTTA